VGWPFRSRIAVGVNVSVRSRAESRSNTIVNGSNDRPRRPAPPGCRGGGAKAAPVQDGEHEDLDADQSEEKRAVLDGDVGLLQHLRRVRAVREQAEERAVGGSPGAMMRVPRRMP
jgi:hypothetical protein